MDISKRQSKGILISLEYDFVIVYNINMAQGKSVPKIFGIVHIIFCSAIIIVDIVDIYFCNWIYDKNKYIFEIIVRIEIFAWLIILPILFILNAVILIKYRHSNKKSMFLMIFPLFINVFAWFTTICAHAAKF